MTEDPRLHAALAALRVALGGYLLRLRAAWCAFPAPAADTAAAATAADTVASATVAGEDADPAGDVARLLAGTGLRDAPTVAEHAAFASAVGDMERHGGPLAALRAALGMDVAAELTVAAAWWAEADPQFGVVLGCVHDDAGRRYASAGLLRLVLGPHGACPPPERGRGDVLVGCGVLEPGAGPDGPLRLTACARRFLAGLPPRFAVDGGARVPPRHAELVTRLAAHLREGAGGAVLVRGPRGSGRRALACAAARAAGASPITDDHPAPQLRLLARLGAAVPVVAAARLPELAWSAADGPLLAWGAPEEPACGAHVVQLHPAGPDQRRHQWRQALDGAGLDQAGEAASVLAARFAFADAEFDATIARARTEAAWGGGALTFADVWGAARRRPDHDLQHVATPVSPAFTLDDLVVAADVRAQLDELVAHVALQDVVLDGWGFRRRLPRGQGVAVLFAGPPGTGETMAAEGLAAALGQDLYRIDLSAVVSKYVGETEKHLSLAFDEAERAAAVLFFDECDALFGKRTEQRDANDRWANLEVNHLLQRVETFTGLVILATNRRAALDEAFLRRLRFTIRFDTPDVALRRELWRRAFPAQTPRTELDFDALAARELAGGSVQASALAAAFLAAAEGDRVSERHLMRALRREYDKLGKAWTGPGAREVAS